MLDASEKTDPVADYISKQAEAYRQACIRMHGHEPPFDVEAEFRQTVSSTYYTWPDGQSVKFDGDVEDLRQQAACQAKQQAAYGAKQHAASEAYKRRKQKASGGTHTKQERSRASKRSTQGNPGRNAAMKILGLKEGFSMAQLKEAYRKAARKAHPDTGGSAEAFRQVSNAKEILTP